MNKSNGPLHQGDQEELKRLEEWRVEAQTRAYRILSDWLNEAEDALVQLFEVRESTKRVTQIGSFDEKIRYGRQLSDTLHRSIETLLRVTGQLENPSQLAVILRQAEAENQIPTKFDAISSAEQEQITLYIREVWEEGRRRLKESRRVKKSTSAGEVIDVEPVHRKKRTKKKAKKRRRSAS